MKGSRVFVLSLVTSFVVSTVVLTACTQQAPASDSHGKILVQDHDETKDSQTSSDDDDDDDDIVQPRVRDAGPASIEEPGVSDAGVVKPKDASSPPSPSKCCEGKGTCVPATAVPAEAASKLKQDTCTGANLCAPTEALTGAAPTKCEAQGPFGQKSAGVCVSNCVDMGSMGANLKQGACDADHKCAPCKVLGQATGLPGCE